MGISYVIIGILQALKIYQSLSMLNETGRVGNNRYILQHRSALIHILSEQYLITIHSLPC